jgi:hypothetical protein
MTLYEAIVAIMLALRPYYGDHESAEDRKDRIELIAKSIIESVELAKCENQPQDSECVKAYDGSSTDLAAIMIMTGFNESGFARHVHENKCNTKGGECDGGRAKSPWQFQRTPLSSYEWDRYKGRDAKSTKLATNVVSRILARFLKNCGSWKGAIAQYATGKYCTWKHAEARYNHFLRIRRDLREKIMPPKKAPAKAPEKPEKDKPIAWRICRKDAA